MVTLLFSQDESIKTMADTVSVQMYTTLLESIIA